jgi:sterol desaturase/sphingolipid hydroxylase (fatty acid hydroxylase superfamily)
MNADLSWLTPERVSFGCLAALLVAESAWPARTSRGNACRRWGFNAALFAGGGLLFWLAATLSDRAGVSLDLPDAGWSGAWHLGLVVLALDALAYGCHVASHKVPLLWRLHRVHHSDEILDVTTTLRQHPLQALWIVPVMLLGASAIGAGPLEAAVYYGLQRAVQALAHANVPFPARLAGWAEWVFVTPRFHHTHHSPDQVETDSNYGELFTVWDRLFGSMSRAVDGRTRFGLSPALASRAAAGVQPAE